MAKAEGSFVGRYGDTLRRLTALDAAKTGALAPQQVGGADTGGFGPSLQVAPPPMPQTPAAGAFSQPEQPAPAAPAAAPAATGAFGGLGAPEMPPVLKSTPGIAGPLVSGDPAPMGEQVPAGPIATGGDKPTSFQDLVGGASEEEQDELASQIEKQAGGKMDGWIAKVRKVLGTEDMPKMDRRETAQYIAEIALRAMSKRSDPAYAQNPDGVFADAVLEASAGRKQTAEKKRLEDREDAQTTRKENREDTVHVRTRKEQGEDHARDRTEKSADDERDHKQALELARVQAQLLKEKGQRTSIQVGDDGTLVLVDLESGEAVDVTKEVDAPPTKGSRGRGNNGGKKRVPVKAREKYDPSTLDDDTIERSIVSMIAEKSKKDRKFRALPLEEQRQIARDAIMRDTGRGNSGGGVQSPGKVTKFSDLK